MNSRLKEAKERVLDHINSMGFSNDFCDDYDWALLLNYISNYAEYVGKESGLTYKEVLCLQSEASKILCLFRIGGCRIAKFEKVSEERYAEDANTICRDKHDDFVNIRLPKRATVGSAGYDFYAPFSFTLKPGESIKIPTGIRCKIKSNWVLKLYPRSGHGFKYLVKLANTVGIIDSDYYNSDNEGHIMVKLVNTGDKVLEVSRGDAFCQGIFVEYGLTVDDEVYETRNGGFGSTGGI